MNSAEGSSSSSSTNASCLQMDNRQIGSGGGRNGGKVSKKTWNGVGFTFMQMEELKQQAMIYKYMEAGVPVPSHLILPIWKSVLTSSGLTGMGCNSSLYYNYKNSLEAEPGRCKRTDGKKWRCSKDVVPDHKYCERHLHRGRSRSRKPVETDAFAATANNPMTIYDGSNNMRSKISPRLGLVQPQDFLCGENIKAYDWQIQ